MLGSGVRIMFVGVGTLANASLALCSIRFGDYDVAYALNSSSMRATGQLSIQVNTTSGTVTKTSISWQFETPASSSLQWTGYTTMTTYGSPQSNWAYWQNFGVGANSGHCGATVLTPGICAMYEWGGLTAVSSGSSGIAQSGITGAVVCNWLPFSYYCSSGYVGWYEFYPSLSNSCLPISSPGDFVESYVNSYSSTYWAAIWDQTTGKACFSSTGMSMGVSHYGQWQVESVPNFIGGTLQIPAFGFWFSPAIAVSYPFDLQSRVSSSLSVGGVSLGAMSYNSSACSGTGFSCFKVT